MPLTSLTGLNWEEEGGLMILKKDLKNNETLIQDQAVRGGQRWKVSFKVKVSQPKEAQRLALQV